MKIETHERATDEPGDDLLELYAAVYAEAPYHESPAEVAEFAAVWRRISSETGFRLVVARDAGRLVGFGVGYALRADSGWWPAGADAEVAAEWITDGVGRSFGIDEFGVRPGWRGRGVASRLHAALLAGRAESRVVLWARVDAPVARAVYAGWGYRPAARMDLPDGRSFLVLCLAR